MTLGGVILKKNCFQIGPSRAETQKAKKKQEGKKHEHKKSQKGELAKK